MELDFTSGHSKATKAQWRSDEQRYDKNKLTRQVPHMKNAFSSLDVEARPWKTSLHIFGREDPNTAS